MERKNDTAEAVKFAIRTAFYHESLPEITALFRGNLFNDSILVETDSLPTGLLPTELDTLRFKIINKNQVAILKKSFSDSTLPNYLYICCFEREDSTYNVSIQSRCFYPFGGGGSIYFTILKSGDSLIVKDRSTGSIN